MAIDLAALKVELQTDPLALGYAQLIEAGSMGQLADALNAPRDINIDRREIASNKLAELIAAADYTALTATERERLRLFLSFPSVDLSNANVRANLLQVFGAGTATRANVQAYLTRKGSRAEQLFGIGTLVSYQDCAAALRTE